MTRMGTALTAGILTVAMGLVAGCGGDTNNGSGSPDSGTPAGPPQTFDYVISDLTIDGNAMSQAPNPARYDQGITGFNLDGRFTGPMASNPADCSHGDFFSTLDPDQNMGSCTAGMARGGASCNGGVDNQLPSIMETVGSLASGTDVRASVREQITTGKVAILIRVENVNGTPGPGFNDNDVTVRVYPLGRPMFANCAMIGMPGQMYAIDSAGVSTPNDLSTARISFSGRIVNGRLVVNPPAADGMANFNLALPIANMNIMLGLFQTQLRVNMTPDRGTGGNLGGYIPVTSLTTMLAPLLPAGIPMSTVTAVLSGVIDVQYPAGNAMGCTQPTGGAISFGLGFSTVRAVLASTTVTGAQSGMCGSSGSSSGGDAGTSGDAGAHD